MVVHGQQRCKYCGRFLYNADIVLPFEIVSTGAIIMKMDIDINCGHCHRSQVCSILPDVGNVRIDK